FVNGAKRLKVGDPSLSDTDLGPVVNLCAAARIKSLLDDARARGCSIVTAGETEGCVIHPTIVIEPPADTRLVKEEIFGPVV
ncbi:aldehyde dehydrogenase family protein, partial [Klebsiella pneumoniae]|uniref:aldehyde dehydrogenase family protein n=1 Tax=Klebsiella pneumoniae TaxID=573 RepID=UPI0013D471FD